MSTHDPEFLRQLHAAFHLEAAEHIQAISQGLLQLEKAVPGQESRSVLEGIFREAHSLKGAARAVNLADVETLCQAMESHFAEWQRQADSHTPTDFNVVHQALDLVAELVTGPAPTAEADHDVRVAAMRDALTPNACRGQLPAADPTATHEAQPLPPETPPQPLPDKPVPSTLFSALDTVRVSTFKLDALLRQAEEMLTLKLTSRQQLTELRELQAAMELWERQWAAFDADYRGLRQMLEQPALRPPAANGAGLLARLLEFVDGDHACFKSLQGRAAALVKAAEQDRRVLVGLVDHLLEDAKRLVMLPFSTLLGMFPKLVRDLCRDQGKLAELTVQGGDVEIDKRLLQEMKDPLIHLVRNCLDHGLERPDVRTQQHKSPQGRLEITVRQAEGNMVEVRVADDGRGIDTARVRQAAIRHGLLSSEQVGQLNDRAAQSLIFQSGVSTSPTLTELSGRGLGLAIVREKVERLGGEVSVESALGRGCAFIARLPLTLATFRGILVQAADQLFVIPTAHVDRVLRIRSSEIKTVDNEATIVFDGRAVPLVRLEYVLGIPPGQTGGAADEFISAVVLGQDAERMAFAVDAVLQEQEVLVKGLGRLLARVRNVGGATVLGSGKPAVILNPSDLLKSATQMAGRPRPAAVPTGPSRSQRDQSILVVEDSITARMLLKNILESAGYRVKTAVDGVDAWTALKSDTFDLVVSDIQMPRLNGFDLTAKIRHDRELTGLPVVLVTGLASREDRERGIDVGANAYIVKRDFDQSNLLATVQRLI